MDYDRNGNLNKNLHKNVSTITYNHLNLPTVITFTTGNTIEFLYDAAGMKLRKTVKVSGTVQYVQDYLSGGVEYRQTGTGVKRVESVFHAEGRYYNTNVDASNTISWRREYNIKDHLGNTRLVFTDRNANGVVDITGTASTSDVLQENHYYSFGLPFEGAWLQNDAAARDNKYQYNGKEFNDDFGLNWNDYGARWYDAGIGRWNGVDPLVEKYSTYSPYNYTLNNPIVFIDPDGRYVDVTEDKKANGKTKVRLEITGKLINNSDRTLSKKEMNQLKRDFKKQLKESFSINEKGFQSKVKVNIEIASSEADIAETDHALRIVNENDPALSLGSEAFMDGHASFGELDIHVSSATIDKKGVDGFAAVSTHEMGHSMNLPHATPDQRPKPNVKNLQFEKNIISSDSPVVGRLMLQGWQPRSLRGTKVIPNEVKLISKSFQEGTINKPRPKLPRA